jgi:glycosyltransferase involved in cell wall biosynthesis
MKRASQVDVLAAKDGAIPQTPVKVCMHIVRTARIDVRAMRTAITLVEAGFAISILDIEYERIQPAKENCGGLYMEHILVPGWLTSRSFEPWFFFNAVKIFLLSIPRLLQTRADIYHASEVTALPACYIAAKLRRKPLIYEAYELPLFDIPLSEMGLLRRCFHKLIGMLLAKILPACAGVVTVSPPIAEEIRKRYRLSKVSLVRNILPYRIVRKSDKLRLHLDLPPSVRIVLYQGNIQPGRGLECLVHAAAFLKQDAMIVMMGQCIGTTQSALESLIQQQAVADRVKILPPVAYEELLDWTASADLGLTLYPLGYTLNVNMVLPNKLFEYLMAGLPVLSSPLEPIAEIITSYDVGQVVPSLAPADVAAAINAMLADHHALARMRRNALEAARNELCWERESQQLIKLYKDILKEPVVK